MANINSVVIVGRLTRDIEVNTYNDFSVGKFSIALSKRVKDKSGAYVEEPQFFDVTFFGNYMQALSPYLLKGIRVAVQGELKQDSWEQDGQRRSKIYILANNVMLLDSKNQSAFEGEKQARPNNQTNQKMNNFKGDFPSDNPYDNDTNDDGIPF